jgi:hypothetical protein
MRKVCAWCRQPLNDEAEDEKPVSHGICDSCLVSALLNGSSIVSTIDRVPSLRKSGSAVPG